MEQKMLSVIEAPDDVNELYARYKKQADSLYASIKAAGKETRLISKTDLFDYAARGYFIYIMDGFFKLLHNGKMIRWYSQSDFIPALDSGRIFTLVSDFGTVVSLFEKNEFLKSITAKKKIFWQWIALRQMEDQINLSLSSAYLRQETKPIFKLKEFNEGAVIMNEGEVAAEIFEMISGSARVTHNSETVGQINEGEVFGEISFLTQSKRTATVKASEKCLVRVIGEADFFDLIKTNPRFLISIAKTLAKRIVELNDRIQEKQVILVES